MDLLTKVKVYTISMRATQGCTYKNNASKEGATSTTSSSYDLVSQILVFTWGTEPLGMGPWG
jgi:hypothetical protein